MAEEEPESEGEAAAERTLQRRELERIGRLAGGVAHDFNNLLSVILGTVDLALADLESGGDVRQDLMEIRKAAERATDLTRQLLAFGRRQVLQVETVELNDFLASRHRILRHLLGGGIRLTLHPSPEPAWVQLDPSQMERVLINLSLNARDAMPRGGELILRVQVLGGTVLRGESPQRTVLLSVTDTGTGMDEATRERIFEPFFTTKGPGEGTGLGLPSVYGIVQQSGGEIEVESRPGEGTTFRLLLPLSKKDALPGELEDGESLILLVEEDEPLAKLTQRILERAGYRVVRAQDGEEALELAAPPERAPDLLLTDLELTGMDGLELAERLRLRAPSLPVLFTVRQPGGVLDSRRLPLGEGHFLAKPYSVEELLDAVGEALGDRAVRLLVSTPSPL